MLDGILDLFDLDGDGELDGIEMAMAYTVMFGNGEERETEGCGIDCNFVSFDDWDA